MLLSAPPVDAKIVAAATFVAGKQVDVVCERGDYIETTDGRALGVVYVVGGKTMNLAGIVCDTLSRQTLFPDWASALITVVHEAEHLQGVSGESEADCAALKIAASVGIRFFGLKRRQLHTIMAQAWADHRAKPSFYRTLC